MNQLARLIFKEDSMKWILGVLLVIGTVFPAKSAEVTLAWDANLEPVDGYVIYWGNVSGYEDVYEHNADVGPYTQVTINGLTVGIPYYFAATAYLYDDGVFYESGYSEELVHTIGEEDDEEYWRKEDAKPSSGGGGCFISTIREKRNEEVLFHGYGFDENSHNRNTRFSD